MSTNDYHLDIAPRASTIFSRGCSFDFWPRHVRRIRIHTHTHTHTTLIYRSISRSLTGVNRNLSVSFLLSYIFGALPELLDPPEAEDSLCSSLCCRTHLFFDLLLFPRSNSGSKTPTSP